MSWVECKYNDDYEIFTEYPYRLRTKTTKHIHTIYIDKKGNKYFRLGNQCVNTQLIFDTQFKNGCSLTIQKSFEFESP